jgi:tripartite-type tricarboxylate transporter receptor subunit TctC
MRTARTLVAALLATAVTTIASAQNWPSRPVKFVIPFPPGGGTDILARPLAQKLTEKWGQPVVIDNRGGAGGTIAAKQVATADPDGYTILFGLLGVNAIAQSLYANPGFDSTKDFASIVMVANTTNLLVVHPSVPVNSVAELIALAKREPGKLNYASPGNGTPSHLATEIFKKMAGVDLTHVPYKGSGPAMTDMLAGNVQVWIANAPPILPHIKTGKLRSLASTSAKRPPSAPDVPTLDEAGLKGYEADTWFGLFAPKGTPKPILDKIYADVTEVLKTKEIQDFYAQQGGEVILMTQEEFTKRVAADVAKWKALISDLKLRIE